MLRTLVSFLAALALMACARDVEESPPSSALSPTITSAAGGGIIFCPRIGVPGEATSYSLEPSCEPGQDYASAPEIRGTIAESPPLPSGIIALTNFVEFTSDPGLAGNVALPPILDEPTNIAVVRSASWYTLDAGGWRRLDASVGVAQQGEGAGMYSGDFKPIPPNLILLAEP